MEQMAFLGGCEGRRPSGLGGFSCVCVYVCVSTYTSDVYRESVDNQLFPSLVSIAGYATVIVSTFMSIYLSLGFECSDYRFTPGILRAQVISFSFSISILLTRLWMYVLDLWNGWKAEKKDKAQAANARLMV